jgi:hypothetical protein
MKAQIARFLTLAVLVGLFSVPHLGAQGKEKAGPQQKANVQGTIQNISKDTSTFTVRTNGTATRLVVFNPKTRFLYGHSDNNKPGSVEQVKVSNYISCAGTFDAKSQLMATDCVYRETK